MCDLQDALDLSAGELPIPANVSAYDETLIGDRLRAAMMRHGWPYLDRVDVIAVDGDVNIALQHGLSVASVTVGEV